MWGYRSDKVAFLVMIENQITVQNSLGVHMRPAGQIVRVCSTYKAEVFLGRNGQEVNAKSVLGVLSLAAERGAVLTVRIDGPDEKDAHEALVELFATHFGEG